MNDLSRRNSREFFTSYTEAVRDTAATEHPHQMQNNTKAYQAAVLMVNVFVISKIIDAPPQYGLLLLATVARDASLSTKFLLCIFF